jgi:hypothetical protein
MTQYYHWPWNKKRMRLFLYYLEIGLSEQDADSVMNTAWVYGYIDHQVL